MMEPRWAVFTWSAVCCLAVCRVASATAPSFPGADNSDACDYGIALQLHAKQVPTRWRCSSADFDALALVQGRVSWEAPGQFADKAVRVAASAAAPAGALVGDRRGAAGPGAPPRTLPRHTVVDLDAHGLPSFRPPRTHTDRTITGARAAAIDGAGSEVEVAPVALSGSSVAVEGSIGEADLGFFMQVARAEDLELRTAKSEQRVLDWQRSVELEAGRSHKNDRELDLKRENDALREEGQKLRQAVATLRQERTSPASAASLSTPAASSQRVRRKVLLQVLLGIIGAMIGLILLIVYFDMVSYEDTSDEEYANTDDVLAKSEQLSKQMVDQRQGLRNMLQNNAPGTDEEDRMEQQLQALFRPTNSRTCCCCSCSRNVSMFLAMLAILTALLGYVLWELGLLQPMFGEWLAYSYVVIALGCFVSLIVWEMWQAITVGWRYLLFEIKKMRDFFRWTRLDRRRPRTASGRGI
mmetsp:Transcript_41039/g.117960  ORF Transcript_41039/g.117960 Transcript_41039/m.117960 type:complete len:469 (-) Transcript_41039:96-1502(-)